MGSPRQTRAASRREGSAEIQESPVTRRTRSSLKSAEDLVESPRAKSTQLQSGFPQRGTRRGRRRSVESIATNDFLKSSAEQPSPERRMLSPASQKLPWSNADFLLALARISEPPELEDASASVLKSEGDSDDDRAARLQDIIDFDLPKLNQWCEKTHAILSSLTRPEPTAEERKRLNTARRFFQSSRRPFAEDGAAYINLLSSDLPYQEDPNAHSAIAKTTCLANLISLLLTLTALKPSRKSVLPFLRELDNTFFTGSGSVPSLEPEAYHLVIRVRFRLLFELLNEEPETESLVLATKIFCTQPATTLEEATEQLRQGLLRNVGSSERNGGSPIPEPFKTQVNEIITKISATQRDEAEELLNTTYPMDEVLADVWAWALDAYASVSQYDEGDDALPDDPNEKEMQDTGREDVSDSESTGRPREYHQLQLSKEPSFIQNPVTLAAVRHTEKYGPRHPEPKSPSGQQPATKKPMPPQIVAGVRKLQVAQVLGPSGPGNRNPGGKAALGAGASDFAEGSDYEDSNGNGGDDYEINEKSPDRSGREQPEHEPHSTSRTIPVIRRRRGRREAGARNPSTSTQATDTGSATATQTSHHNRIVSRPKVHQTREKWSHGDTLQLLDLIADPSLQCSWAAMEERAMTNHIFHTPRHQQAIRDKARNLKKAYLCTDEVLPRGFDNVYLSKKEENYVIASGRNPDRMEADVDERGRAINTMLDE